MNKEIIYTVIADEEFHQALEELINKFTKKDYEILKFSDGFNEYYKTSDGRFTINLAYFYSEKELLNKYNINSVKYIPTQEIFTIGDRIEWNNLKSTLTKIDLGGIIGSKVRLFFEDGRYLGINIVKKVKQFILKTIDEIDIFEGDRPYVLSESDNIYQWCTSGITNGADKTMKYFSTYEAAKKYQEKNKTIYITNEGTRIIEGSDFWFVTCDFQLKYWDGHKMDTLKSNKIYLDNVIKFSEKKNAELYIELNKKQYSKNDILQFLKDSHPSFDDWALENKLKEKLGL